MNELQNIQDLIYIIRGQRVMLDFDLAMLYEVETRSLNQTVKRNARRFPNDFMFQLTEQEWNLISSQFVMTSRMKRPKKSLPYAFTELGALMLSSVLRSPVADQNDINESTRAQLDAISLALSELQASRSQNATLKNRRPIGFIQHKEDDE